MEFRILGPIETLDSGRLVPLPRGRGRALLALLILRAGEVVSTDRLIDELWGDEPPPTVETALQGLVSRLRKCLEPNRAKNEPPTFIVTRSPGYLLNIDPGRVDANRFRRLVAEAGELPDEEATQALRRALSLWRGPALTDVMYEPFAQAEIAALEDLRLAAIERRIEADLALGLDSELVGELEGLIVENPTRERLREHIMLALYRSERQADALEVYADTRRTLVEELGLDPGPSLQRLENMILRQDPSLDLQLLPLLSGPAAEAKPSLHGPSPQWIAEERRTVTVAFIDVEALTGESESADAEVAHQVVATFLGKAANVVTGHGGSVEHVIGDTLVSVFGVPAAREDDALRAVRAAVDLRHLLRALNRELSPDSRVRMTTRIGISTGEVVMGRQAPGKTMPSGMAVRGAARLQQVAAPGEILVGEATRLLIRKSALLEPALGLALDSRERPLPAWRMVDLVPGAPALPRQLGVPMIGREPELAQLRAAYEGTVRERSASRFTVLGDAGIGKTRLARELARSVGEDARVLTGHCPAYGSGITFWPLREIALSAAGGTNREALIGLLGDEDDAEAIADHVAGAIGSIEAVENPGALFPMLRRFFEGLARHGPVAVILDDLHWAQPTFLDLVEYLTETTQASVFLLCLARPEFLEKRAGWAGDASASSLVLEPLGPEESQKLVANRLVGQLLPGEALAQIVETAQGNPLFAEQLVAALGETEGAPSIPVTLQALLAARLDRLGPAERDLIRSASVLGSHFSVGALSALLPNDARRTTSKHLQVLEKKNLILATSDPREKEFSFGHVLIQQAAYLSMTKATRADLHEQVVEWLDNEAGPDTIEFEETTGYHLEQAFEYRRELGILDDHDLELGARGGEKLANAGRRAFALFDAAAAENLLSRARSLLPPDHPEQWEVERLLAEAFQVMGRHSEAERALTELLDRMPRGESDALLEHSLRLEQVRVRLATGPDPIRLETIQKEIANARTAYEAAGDESGLAQVCFLLGEICLRRGHMTDMEHLARLGLTHADRSHSSREQLGARRMVATVLEQGPTPVEKGIRECQELVVWHGSENPAVQPVLAHLRSMLGDFDVARSLIGSARQLLSERYRARRPLVLLKKRSAHVEILAGNLAAAVSELRESLQHSLDMRVQEISEVAAILSRVLSMQGDSDEAARIAEMSKKHAPSESVTAQALWRSAAAHVEISRGNPEEGERLVHESIGLVPTEMLNLNAEIRLDLAHVLASGGQRARATAATEEAISFYELKGNVVGAQRARSFGASVTESIAPR